MRSESALKYKQGLTLQKANKQYLTVMIHCIIHTFHLLWAFHLLIHKQIIETGHRIFLFLIPLSFSI